MSVSTPSPAPTATPDATASLTEADIRNLQLEALYSRATESFRSGLFYTAKQQFLDLGDYKDAAAMAAQCIQPLPATGELYRKSGFKKGDSLISLQNRLNDAGVAYCVYNTADELCLILFTRAGAYTEAKLPAGRYKIKEARGTQWYGSLEYFGEEGYYCIVKDPTGVTYYPIESGYAYDFVVHNNGVGEEDTVSFSDFTGNAGGK